MYTHIHLVYAGLATLFVLMLAYMFLYNRTVKSSKTDFINKGEMTASNQNPETSKTKPGSGRPTS